VRGFKADPATRLRAATTRLTLAGADDAVGQCFARARFEHEIDVRVLALTWVGTRTTEYAATVAFFTDVLGLSVHSSETDFTVLEVPDGSTVEVFGPASRYNHHLTHPVAGFRVSDLEGAVEELRAAGADVVLPIQGTDAHAWMHFRAPDGFVYELSQDG
jgi:catechol 2,3-dioxygenase-like lactoylglutathione lyase family enzyme